MIRPASPADEPALRALDHATWSSLSSPAPPPPPERLFDLDGVLVAELEDGIAGYVKLGPALPIEASATCSRSRACPSPPTTGAAASARALMRAAIREARTAGARRLTLRVLAHNAAARDLYTACGFEVEGVLRELLPARRALRGRRPDGAPAYSRRLTSVEVTVSAPERATSRTL